MRGMQARKRLRAPNLMFPVSRRELTPVRLCSVRLSWRQRARPSTTLHEIQICPKQTGILLPLNRPGGFDVMSYTTRLIPRTSLTMRLEMRCAAPHTAAEPSRRSCRLRSPPRGSRRYRHTCAGRPSRRRLHRQQHRKALPHLAIEPRALDLVDDRSHRPPAESPRAPAVTSPRMRTASPGPGNGCRSRISSGIPGRGQCAALHP
jgi:hypothetical protein